MKKYLLLFLALVAISASAQNLAVAYDYTFTSLKDGVKKDTDKRVLVSSGTRSMFYDPEAWTIDSIKSTPGGRDALRQQALAAIACGQKIAASTKSNYFCKNADGTITSYYNENLSQSVVTEPLGGIDWQLVDSTKTVAGYECQLAEASYHGRNWSAWFTLDVPVQEGPWKLCGLPGLILEAEADGGVYGFVATTVGTIGEAIPHIYGADEYEKTDRLRFWRDKRDYTDHAAERIQASLGGVTVKFEDGSTLENLYVPRDVLDFIETDY